MVNQVIAGFATIAPGVFMFVCACRCQDDDALMYRMLAGMGLLFLALIGGLVIAG